MAKLLVTLCGAAAAVELMPRPTFSMDSTVSLCNPCFQLAGQGINSLLNIILNEGVVGGCTKLCAAAIPAGGVVATACELVCTGVGAEVFIKAIQNVDLDPIYLCEVIHACPAAPDDAYLELVHAGAEPAVVVHGGDISLSVELNVANDTGVGEFSISIDGPGTATPLSQGFFLKAGVPAGDQMLAVSLTLKDGQDSQGFPATFEPGLYNYTFHVCQGECGSKHPHSKDFGHISGVFNMTAEAPSPSPSPTPAPPSCFDQFDERSCSSTTDDMGEACQWCDDVFMCQDSFMPCNGVRVQV